MAAEKNNVEELEADRLAREEILRDIKRAKARTETVGATGWRPCPLPKTNKRFLRNTIVGAIQANRTETKKPRLHTVYGNRKETDFVKTVERSRSKGESLKDKKVSSKDTRDESHLNSRKCHRKNDHYSRVNKRHKSRQ